MKIAITSTGTALEDQVDPRFGRCEYFMIVDTDLMQFEAIANEGGVSGGGAGIAAAKVVVDAGAKAVLTGNCGPNAHRVLIAAGVKLYTGLRGTIAQAVERFKTGSLEEATSANVEPHSGMNG